MPKQYLDDNGNPIAAPSKVYLDDSGNPVQPKNQVVPQAQLDQIKRLNANPTQFENERNPANQSGVLSTLGSALKNMVQMPKAQNPYPGMGTEQKVQAFQQAQEQGRQEKDAGYSGLYRAATIPAQVAGVNVPAMEHQADIGNARGVLGEAIAPAAVAAGSIYGPKILDAAGSTLKNSAYGTMNNALGVFGRDTKYGINPGRGVVQEGIMGTQRGMLDKINTAVSDNGAKLQDVANANSHVPVNIEASVNAPLSKAYENGVAGVAPSNYLKRIQTTANELTQMREIDPATGNFAYSGQPRNLASANPPEVLNFRRGVSDRTNFATDAAGQNVNPILKQIYGGVTRDLHAAVPDMAPIDSRLADLQGAQGSLSKTINRRLASPGIASVGNVPGEILGAAAGGPIGAAVGGLGNFAARTMPLRSTMAQGLYQSGRAVSAFSPFVRPAAVGSIAGRGGLYGQR